MFMEDFNTAQDLFLASSQPVTALEVSTKQLNNGSIIGLYIIYFMRYDTYHDTHEVMFDMYQRYILSGFDPTPTLAQS